LHVIQIQIAIHTDTAVKPSQTLAHSSLATSCVTVE